MWHAAPTSERPQRRGMSGSRDFRNGVRIGKSGCVPTVAQDPDHLTVYAQAMPEKPAVIDPDSGRVLTYAELEERANRLADALRGIGLRAGDRVVWCGPNSVEVITILNAARKAGLVAVPL